MVSDRMDMLGDTEARPDDTSTIDSRGPIGRKVRLVEEVASSGEAIVELRSGDTVEFHGDDSYFFPHEGIVFTEGEVDGDDAESWYFAEDFQSVHRH